MKSVLTDLVAWSVTSVICLTSSNNVLINHYVKFYELNVALTHLTMLGGRCHGGILLRKHGFKLISKFHHKTLQ